jgi:hypothetical protein
MSIQNNNIDDFKTNFNDMIKMASINYIKSYGLPGANRLNQRCNLLCIRFSNLSNFIALLGGKIKANQMISGNMADILSNIYMSYALLHTNNSVHKIISDKCIEYLCNEAERKMNYVIDNYPNIYIKQFIKPFRYKEQEMSIKDINTMYEYIISNEDVINVLKEDIYTKDSIVEKLEKLDKIKDRKSKEYIELYNDIISVGEYDV